MDTERAVSWLSIFTSISTLVCCALPTLLVAIGAGAVLAGLVSAVPGLVWLSERKALVFTLAGAMLAIAALLQWRARRLPCPIDPALARACMRGRAWSARVLATSVVIYSLGALFAFALPALAA